MDGTRETGWVEMEEEEEEEALLACLIERLWSIIFVPC